MKGDFLSNSTHVLNNARSLAYGHHRFLQRNTGETDDGSVQHFILNPQNVMSNQRQFVGYTMMEGQPNGDATTESHALLIIGYVLMYQATRDPLWLQWAETYWQAYIDHFYQGQAIPDPPAPFYCNWLVNGKEPVLASYPLSTDGYPSHAGFKGIEFTFTNGQCVIPQGAPYYGEYLDIATYAFDGALAWQSIIADVQALNSDGSVDWSTAGTKYPVDWIIDRLGRKVNSAGDVVDTGHPASAYGTVQLQDTTISGAKKLNFATRNPVADGGTMLERNVAWLNRPLVVPVAVEWCSNSADSEQWFGDACYLLWKATGKQQHYNAWQSVIATCQLYAAIGRDDRFFRKSTIATSPWTDGISYDYSYPSGVKATYGRNSTGQITMSVPQAAQFTIEQQTVWYRINNVSKLHIEVGAVGDDGTSIVLNPSLMMAPTNETPKDQWVKYLAILPTVADLSVVTYEVAFGAMIRATRADGGEYLLATAPNCSPYSGATVATVYDAGVLNTRPGNVVKITMGSDGGAVLGFWSFENTNVALSSITYKSDVDAYDIRIEDDQGWRWYWVLPATNGNWETLPLNAADLKLSGYQPNANGRSNPTAPTYSTFQSVTLLLDAAPKSGDTSDFSLYCFNDVPDLFNGDGWFTKLFSFRMDGTGPFKAVVGDCMVNDYRDDALTYTPGVIPYSNNLDATTGLFDGWHGMPYPGYQYPVLWAWTQESTKLKNMLQFMYDAQLAYQAKFGVLGPVAPTYIWNRWDNLEYGDPNTFIFQQWHAEPWAGYQPRAMMGAARAWYELYLDCKTVPDILPAFVENWISFLDSFQEANAGKSPTVFSAEAAPSYDSFTGHMCGLYLGASCYAKLAGSTAPKIDKVIDTLMQELLDNYQIATAGDAMAGCWSPSIRPGTDNGMFYGFWAGEILRGIALYIEVKAKRGA